MHQNLFIPLACLGSQTPEVLSLRMEHHLFHLIVPAVHSSPHPFIEPPAPRLEELPGPEFQFFLKVEFFLHNQILLLQNSHRLFLPGFIVSFDQHDVAAHCTNQCTVLPVETGHFLRELDLLEDSAAGYFEDDQQSAVVATGQVLSFGTEFHAEDAVGVSDEGHGLLRRERSEFAGFWEFRE